MRVVYNQLPIYLSNGATAGVLDGEYEATPSDGQQPGWHALRRVKEDGTVDDVIVANVHIVGFSTT
ncbi:hypothetical protein [uncultured Sphingomonas sp.]|uniref:hypothetical protein n=1 Tax=uncultured Sphingomonas sp. TaxID=158754 RepID=UPI0025D04906|nr:hypothetical protein [uncultured Sphingomonas sp.]